MAEGFLDRGVDATLVFPWVGGMLPWAEVPDTYGLQRAVPRYLLRGSRVSAMRPLRLLRPAALQASLAAFALSVRSTDVVLARRLRGDPSATLLALKRRRLLRSRLFVELHDARHFTTAADSSVDGYIVITEALAAFLRNAGVDERRVLVAPNAVDPRAYAGLAARDRRTLRSELGLRSDRVIACYTGQLYPGRNVDALIAALEHLAPAFSVVIVGGHVTSDVQRITALAERIGVASRVVLVGQQPAHRAAMYQVAADVLVIPYDTAHTQTASWCSPLKVREYLAAGRPSRRFPCRRWPRRCATTMWRGRGETPRDLAVAIEGASRRPPRSTHEVARRLEGATWSDRARAIVEFIER